MAPAKDGADASRATAAAERLYAQRLRDLGLTIDAIDRQSLDELKDSLDRVDEALRDQHAFEQVVAVPTRSHSGVVTATSTGSSDSSFLVSIGPLLLDRRRRIVERIRELADQPAKALLERLASDTVASVDEGLKEAAVRALEQMQSGREAAQQELGLDSNHAVQKEQLELYAMKAKIWQGFLARESVATIVGGLLLLGLAGALLVAMFVEKPTLPVITNAFLIILGYFFGHSTVRERAETRMSSRSVD